MTEEVADILRHALQQVENVASNPTSNPISRTIARTRPGFVPGIAGGTRPRPISTSFLQRAEENFRYVSHLITQLTLKRFC